MTYIYLVIDSKIWIRRFAAHSFLITELYDTVKMFIKLVLYK